MIKQTVSERALENTLIESELYRHIAEQMTWESFIDLLELICQLKGWYVEYEDYSDRSIAIFAE